MLVMEPESGRMEVAPLPALFQRFTNYTLDVAIQRPRTTMPADGRLSAA